MYIAVENAKARLAPSLSAVKCSIAFDANNTYISMDSKNDVSLGDLTRQFHAISRLKKISDNAKRVETRRLSLHGEIALRTIKSYSRRE